MADVAKQSKAAAWFLGHWEWIVALSCAVGVFYLYQDYGIGWDSEVHSLYGESVLDYFLRGMTHPEETQMEYLHLYGLLFDLPSAALHRLLGLDRQTLRGLLSGLLAVATLPALAKIARRIGGEPLAVFSTVCLVLTPQFFGQAFINSKDIPLACTVSWAVLAICRLLDDDRGSWRSFLLLGLAFGAVLSTRVGGVFVFVFLATALGWRLLPVIAAGAWSRLKPARPGTLAVKAFVALALAWTLMVSAWPYAHKNPFLNPIEAYRVAAAFPNVYTVLFNGRLIDGNALPFTYLPTYLVLNFSPVLLVLLLAGAGLAVATCARGWRQRETTPLFLVLFWIGFPVAYVMVMRPNIYDGARHFVFLLPACAIIAGLALARGWAALSRHGENGTMVAGAVGGVLLIFAALPLVLWHPYQYAYLNFLAGPRAEVHRRFETDYWLTSYKAAAEWLNEQQELSPRPLSIVVAANNFSSTCLVHFLNPRIKWKMTMDNLAPQRLPLGTDYYVGVTRYKLDENFNGSPVVWEERRGGVLLCVIRSDRHLAVEN